MSFKLLEERINEGIRSSGNNTEVARFRHHKTALNNLIKSGVLDPKFLELALGADLENTLEKYKAALESQGKDVRSPLSRVRRLAEFYSTIFEIDHDNTTFSELLRAAVARKYGEKLWTGPVTPKTQSEIKSKYVTYRTVATELIVASKSEDPTLWGNVNLEKPPTLGSASKIVRDYITGESIPAERVSDERIRYIEKFLYLPKNSLLSKVKRKIDHNNRGRKPSERSQSHQNRRKHVHTELNENLQKVLDEYAAYKKSGTQPKIINIPAHLQSSRHASLQLVVKEFNKVKDRWTVNSKGKCGSEDGFKRHLVSFQNYCVTELGIAFEDVSTVHLTDPILLHELCQKAGTWETGGTFVTRLLNWIYRTARFQGYLYFCADMGDRSEAEFFEDLAIICDSYPGLCEMAKQGIGGKKGALRGKENIQFLLKMPSEVRKRKMHEAASHLLERAEGLQREANRRLKLIKKDSTPSFEKQQHKSAASHIRKAMNAASAALVIEIAFVNIPRSMNWTILKYYPTAIASDKTFSSLTFLRQRNRYHFYIPCYGQSLIHDEKKIVRYLKNGDAENTVDIDIELPEALTPTIKRFLAIRKDYIEMDLVRFGEVEASDVELLMPWRSYRKEAVKNPAVAALRERFINEESKFSENFEAMTYAAFVHTDPDEKQHGINMHAMRHLVAETHLEDHPGDYIGAAAKLNDDVEQIIKTYGDKDRTKAMRRVAEEEYAL